MGTLEFDGEAVRELYEHARSCKQFRGVYGSEPKPALLLVHDQGVYLMSAGLPSMINPDKPGSAKVVYAKGCHPDLDEDWYQEARDLVGGDDFAEAVPLDMFGGVLDLGLLNINITIKVTATQLTVSYTGGKKGKKQESTITFADEALDFGDF